MRQIVLDTETTGIDIANGNRILEIGCVELLNRQLTGKHLHLYINPERDSEPGALQVHGLTTAFLSDKPVFAAIAQQFLDYVRDAEIIIHNAAFDVRFLDHELQLAGLAPFAQHVSGVVDTLAMAKEMYPGKRNSLDALCTRYGIDNSSRTLHGALLDAELLADVYICLTRGQESLVMDDTPPPDETSVVQPVPLLDLRSITLPVLRASDAEQQAHADMLQVLDKASNGKTLWRQWPPA